MARTFTCTAPLDMAWRGINFKGVAGKTFVVPEEHYIDFLASVVPGIPGVVTWGAAPLSTAVTFAPALTSAANDADVTKVYADLAALRTQFNELLKELRRAEVIARPRYAIVELVAPVGGTITDPLGAHTALLATSPVFKIMDDYGATCVDDNETEVVLALTAESDGGTLGGVLTSTAVNGIVRFGSLTLTEPAAAATLTATSAGLLDEETSAFAITDHA